MPRVIFVSFFSIVIDRWRAIRRKSFGWTPRTWPLPINTNGISLRTMPRISIDWCWWLVCTRMRPTSTNIDVSHEWNSARLCSHRATAPYTGNNSKPESPFPCGTRSTSIKHCRSWTQSISSCVCACKREREREREGEGCHLYSMLICCWWKERFRWGIKWSRQPVYHNSLFLHSTSRQSIAQLMFKSTSVASHQRKRLFLLSSERPTTTLRPFTRPSKDAVCTGTLIERVMSASSGWGAYSTFLDENSK